jgi:hypothetical protein
MAVTKIADILIPDVWNEYGAVRTMELSALFQSGIMAQVPGIQVPNGGATVNMPFFNDLTGDAEVLDDGTPLTPGAIGTGQDVAAVLGRGRAWGANDLAAVLSGADPVRAIQDLLATYWARQDQKELIAALNGAFAAASMSGNVHDISGGSGAAAVIDAESFIDACYKLGDAQSAVTAVAMHSAVVAKLAKDDLIAYVRPSEGSADVPMYQGKRVIVDDGMPVNTGVYTSYIFAPGAVGFAQGVIGDADLETDRDILAGDTVIAMRRRSIIHPRGIKWQGTPTGAFPSRAELATGTNWLRVYPNKNIRIVQFKYKIAAA